jgi:hypothetical protein
MQFSVPQFIEIEDKIFGPLTFRQFVYVVGGAGLSYMSWNFLPSPIGILLVAPIMGGSLALAFYKYNDRPFILFLESAFYFFIKSKLYLWKHESTPIVNQAAIDQKNVPLPAAAVPSMTNSKLKDLSWSLDINEYVDRAGQAIEKSRQ